MTQTTPRTFSSFLKDHLASYLEFKRSLHFTSFGGSSLRSLAHDLDYYLTFFGIWSLEQLTDGTLNSWVHIMNHQSASTKNKKLVFVRGFFKYLLRIGVVQKNPALCLPFLKTNPSKPHIYSLKEIQKILSEAALYKEKRPHDLWGWTLETMLFLIYACGLRISEAIKLKIQDVDFEENALSLWETKFHKERLVPFSSAVAQKLKSYLARRLQSYPWTSSKAPFFRSLSGLCRAGTVESHFRKILVRCALAKPKGRGPRIHDLRHTFAVHRLYKWYQEGHDIQNRLPLLSTYMGHVSVENTQVYLTVTQALLREADRRFQRAFEDVTKRSLRRALKHF